MRLPSRLIRPRPASVASPAAETTHHATIEPNGQLTLPTKLLRKVGWRSGDQVVMRVEPLALKPGAPRSPRSSRISVWLVDWEASS
jgi:hypothetical protein